MKNNHSFVDVPNDDFVGTVKNRFTVIGKCIDENKKRHDIYYKCLCECGNIFYRNKYEIKKHVKCQIFNGTKKESPPLWFFLLFMI